MDRVLELLEGGWVWRVVCMYTVVAPSRLASLGSVDACWSFTARQSSP